MLELRLLGQNQPMRSKSEMWDGPITGRSRRCLRLEMGDGVKPHPRFGRRDPQGRVLELDLRALITQNVSID